EQFPVQVPTLTDAFFVDASRTELSSHGGVLPAGFTLDSATGKLTFPASYDNTSDADETFSVRISVYVTGPGADGALWVHDNELRNTASFTSTGAPTQEKTADIQ